MLNAVRTLRANLWIQLPCSTASSAYVVHAGTRAIARGLIAAYATALLMVLIGISVDSGWEAYPEFTMERLPTFRPKPNMAPEENGDETVKFGALKPCVIVTVEEGELKTRPVKLVGGRAT